ncbi:MAG: rhodanese-like domain-containing protein [Planctomycetes bacterium]|nr:rhodanese-like domain-containing protein [Planctomycetota bacterium]
MVKLLPTFVLVFLLFLTGCNAGISDKNLSYVSPSDVRVLMSSGAGELFGTELRTILIDCRQRWEFNKAHIPDATPIPFGHLQYKLYELDHAGIIIVTGQTYNDPVAIAMSKALMELGFKDVKTLRGGFVGWEDAGGSVKTEE